jgi:hypothetical protein
MRISESTIRRIIREEARRALREGHDRMSILHPGVTPEEFARSYRRFWGSGAAVGKSWQDMDWLRDPRYQDAGLSEETMREIERLVIMCEGPGDEFPLRFSTLGAYVSAALGDEGGKTGEFRRAVVASADEFDESIISNAEDWRFINFVPFGPMNDFAIRRGINAVGSLDSEALERRFNFMSSMDVFLEQKELDPDILEKLRSLAAAGGEGLMQAADLYGML